MIKILFPESKQLIQCANMRLLEDAARRGAPEACRCAPRGDVVTAFEHRSEGEALERPSCRLEVDGCESGGSFHSDCPVSVWCHRQIVQSLDSFG